MTKCCKKNKNKKHPDHSQEISRLNRAIGQMGGIKKMIEENKYCIDILTQCKAVKSAIKSIEINILERHLKSCVMNTLSQKNQKDKEKKIKEILNLLKKYKI